MPIARIRENSVDIDVRVNAETGKPELVNLTIGEDRIHELRNILFRAANTLDPAQTPEWVTNLLDVLDKVPS